MTFENQAAYDNPAERLQALGMDARQGVFLDPKGKQQLLIQNGGMIAPQRRELRRSLQIFKYTDARQPPDTYLSSGWWFERAALDRILAFAKAKNYPEGYAVRLLGCVPPEWGSNLDLVIRARLNVDLVAFHGLANSALGQARDGLGNTPIVARNEIESWRLPQLYIPGLRDTRTGRSNGRHHSWFQEEARYPVTNAFTWIHRASR